MSVGVAQFTDKAKSLFKPARYKILKSGRGAAKSWDVARALLVLGARRRLRILCCREIQNSIKDSVHKLLKDQIDLMGLQAHYDVQENEIHGVNGTEFLFSGLHGHTVTSLKSYEGIDICWVEEGQTVVKHSWDILTPTIRKEGSEIWITFNPELDTDETYVRFWSHPPPNAVLIDTNWRENPWFTEVLEQERLHCLYTDPDGYENIWEGKCRATVAGAIYAKEVADLLHSGRYCHVPYDPRLKVHTIWDLGWNDSMAILLVQRTPFDCRVIDYIEHNKQTLDWYAAKLNAMPYNWGWDWLPHDGFHNDYKTGKSAYDILRAFGRRVQPKVQEKYPVPNVTVEKGIKACRMLFPLLVVNSMSEGVKRVVECWKRYRRSIPQSTGEEAAPLKDEYAHGADATRYLGLVVNKLKNDEEEDWRTRPQMPAFRPLDAGMGVLG